VLRYGGDGWCKPPLIEGSLPGSSVRVNEQILVSTFHRSGVPEAVLIADPMGASRDVYYEVEGVGAKVMRALVVYEGSLCGQRGQEQHG
jgi:hypothetical protein